MTADFKSQLAVLRRRITRIQNRPPAASLPAAPPNEELWRVAPAHYDANVLLPGEVVENAQGQFFLSERFFPAHRRHGSVEFSRLAELTADLLSPISREEIPPCPPQRWAFLDTETTGLAGGTGTCAFLVGVGVIEDAGFRVRLFFMRDYDEEAAMLEGLAAFLADYDVLVTYNGKVYDAPLLETRYRMARMRPALERLAHLDLLFAARRLWRLRLETCRLIELENQILGVEREGDLPGEMIPYFYFDYLRTRQAFRLVPLFHHNVMDIVSLAVLTAVILPTFADPAQAPLHRGEDLLGLARWLRQVDPEQALNLYRRAVDGNLRDQHLFAALWEIALIEKKLGRRGLAVEIWRDLAGVRNSFRRQALEELAKHYEHEERDYGAALEMTTAALALEPDPDLEHRRQRLERKSATQSCTLL